MNNFFVPSFLISVMVHAGLFVIPQGSVLSIKGPIDPKVNKNIEVSIVRLLPDVQVIEKEVKSNPISPKKKDTLKEESSLQSLSAVTLKKEKGVKQIAVKKEKKGVDKKEKIKKSVSNIEKIKIPVLKDKYILKQVNTLLIKNPPQYPQLAIMKGWQGKVVILATTDDKGRVVTAYIHQSSGINILDMEAIRAVRKWNFSGVDTSIQVKIPIEFVLYDE